MHENPVIMLLALALTVALVGGLAAKRLGLSPIVGYLVAGIAIGLFGHGAIDPHLVSYLAEIGVVLLMFGVGIHFHLKDLMAVKTVAITGALGQSAAATAATVLAATAFGVPWGTAILLGISVSVASTVVLARSLADRDIVDTPAGHTAVGWLVVEDILTVLVLVLLPPIAGEAGSNFWETLGIALAKLAALLLIMVFAGAKVIPWILLRTARLRSRELFTLTVLVIAVVIATLSAVVFGASMALGGFLAGMVVGQSKVSYQAAADALPMRDAFAVLFFVSVGLLFDPSAVLSNPWLFAALLGVILLVKPLVAVILVFILRRPVKSALTVAGGLAQIGEFSFILSAEASRLGLQDAASSNLLVAAAVVSMVVNPWWFTLWLKLERPLSRLRGLARWLSNRRPAQPQGEMPAGPLALVVGYGPVGRAVVERLIEAGIRPVVLEMNVDTVLELQSAGIRAYYGDATGPDLLVEAGLDKASYLLLSLPDTAINLRILRNVREHGSEVRVLARARYLRDREALQLAGADIVCVEEEEAAMELAEAFLRDRAGNTATASS